jgi:hypothetical protein
MYNPDTGRIVSVVPGSPEAAQMLPTSEKPTKAEKKVSRRVESALLGGAATLVKAGIRGVPAAASAAGITTGMAAAYIASAGIISYLATTAIINAAAEGQTLANLIGQARSMAITQFHRKMGRFPTREEYADLRKRVGNAILDHFKAATGNIPAMWRNFVALFKGG